MIKNQRVMHVTENGASHRVLAQSGWTQVSTYNRNDMGPAAVLVGDAIPTGYRAIYGNERILDRLEKKA